MVGSQLRGAVKWRSGGPYPECHFSFLMSVSNVVEENFKIVKCLILYMPTGHVVARPVEAFKGKFITLSFSGVQSKDEV